MELNEKHHAYIVASFYGELKKKGDRGIAVFKKGAQQYGEERGRRMALRVLRDNRELDFSSYFVYSEWESTPGFYNMTMDAVSGAVLERVTKCPWAFVFAQMGLEECGICYCREIDRAIARGFNPDLFLGQTSLLYLDGSCSFTYKDQGIRQDLFKQVKEDRQKLNETNVLPMTYHCAHVLSAFSRVILDVYGCEGQDMICRVRSGFTEKLGEDAAAELDRYRGEDFTRLPL